MNFDDDVKIFNPGANDEPAQAAPPHITEPDLLDKARSIGMELAQTTRQAERGFELDIDDDLLLQRRLLLCFAVSTALEEYSAAPQIARTALNTFYDTLKRSDPEFYDDIGSSGSLSFYYHARHQVDNTIRRIGQTFAMMCGQDGDPVCQELGEALYCRYVNMVKVLIRSHGLIKN